jgi:predicted Fe-Mo cluster-binding NifX family protein
VRWSGPVLFAEISIEVEPYMTIDEAHPITEEIEHRIRAKFESVYSVVVHVEPKGREQFKVLIPINEEKPDSKLSSVLSKSRYFAIVQISSGGERTEYIENPFLKMKARIAPSFKDFLIRNGITDLVCKNIGDSVYGLLLAYNIFCWRSGAQTLSRNIELFKSKKLEKMKNYLVRLKPSML